MNHSLCLSNFRHDIRLMHQLRSYELRHFLILLDYANDRRDPTFIPARKREEVRLILGFGSGDKGRQRLKERLARFEELELIQTGEDGSLLISYLLDQYEEEDEPPLPAAHANGTQAGGSHAGGVDAPDRRQAPERRQRGRTYSMTPDAIRNRAKYHDLKAKTEVFAENLQVSPSKPPPVSGEFTQNLQVETSENLRENAETLPEVSLARASDVRNVVGGSKDSLNSEDVNLNVPRNLNSPQNLQSSRGENLRQATAPASGSAAGAAVSGSAGPRNGRPPKPLPRPSIAPQQVPAARHADVREVIELTGDDPKEWGAAWNALWKHCHQHNLLHCWDEGFVMLLWRTQVSPPSGPGAIKNRGKWLRGAILPLLMNSGHPYLSASERQAAQEPVDEEEAEEARREVAEMKAAWEAEERSKPGGITPLDDILPEVEDEH